MGYLFTLLAKFSETTIESLGAHLTIVVSNIFFLGIPVIFTAGAYAMIISQKMGVGLITSIFISLVFSLILGVIFALSYLRLSQNSFTVFTLISILAFDAVLRSWDGVTGGVLGISGIMRPEPLSSLKSLAFFQFALMLICLFLEYLILRTWIGRSLIGMKENKSTIESLGTSTKFLGFFVIIISSVIASIAGMIAIWRIQFLDPHFGGIVFLIQIITIAIIAAKPKVRWLALSALFIVMLPEALRFLNLPVTIFGHLRILIYSVLLIIVLKTLSKNLLPRKRFI